MEPTFKIESIEKHTFIDVCNFLKNILLLGLHIKALQGQLTLYVKWTGFESSKNTWEPWLSYRKAKKAAIRKDKKAAQQRTRHQKAILPAGKSATILKDRKEEQPLAKTLTDFKEPSKNWEKDAEIVGISLATDKQWQFDLQWPNGDITLAHPLKDVRVRCPQKLIELFVTNAELE
ncbi:hypothetical protein VE03_10291 [Pseudogymnoascus sp. 23342-1-I1]|nr:hypothetical protein VE03_10291 [Pseudogymnoascus sp. 23342-1-I1]